MCIFIISSHIQTNATTAESKTQDARIALLSHSLFVMLRGPVRPELPLPLDLLLNPDHLAQRVEIDWLQEDITPEYVHVTG
jgi:hypothetical protein